MADNQRKLHYQRTLWTISRRQVSIKAQLRVRGSHLLTDKVEARLHQFRYLYRNPDEGLEHDQSPIVHM